LTIGESHTLFADLLAQNTIFLNQVFDDLLLALIHPSGYRDNEKRKWIQTRTHPGRLPRTKTSYLTQNRTHSSFNTLREREQEFAMDRPLETESRDVLTGHEGGTPDTAKDSPTDHRASARPYQAPSFASNNPDSR
jgi:hypothetical protein